jgi:hypothetical protein
MAEPSMSGFGGIGGISGNDGSGGKVKVHEIADGA